MPYLPYFDIDPDKVRYVGTGLWNRDGIGREPAMVGGWFAGLAPEGRAAFVDRFAKAYGRPPHGRLWRSSSTQSSSTQGSAERQVEAREQAMLPWCRASPPPARDAARRTARSHGV